MGIYVKRGEGSEGSARVCQVRSPRYRRAPGAQSDYWFLSTKDSHHAPTLLVLWVASSGGALKIEGLAWFSNQAIMQCIIKKNSYILGPTRKYPQICQKESPPMPDITLFGTNLRQSIPNGLEALPNLFAKNWRPRNLKWNLSATATVGTSVSANSSGINVKNWLARDTTI
jgi:hypothetical protein